VEAAIKTGDDIICQISLGWANNPRKIPSSKETKYFDEDNDGSPEKKKVSFEFSDNFSYKNRHKKTWAFFICCS
jgi:hypothetical protein